ncbi:hypothetical protein QLR68_27130 [Micromonospora sp. DH15]|nr:hypothetical protein [Micromonospora sp. DH15]
MRHRFPGAALVALSLLVTPGAAAAAPADAGGPVPRPVERFARQTLPAGDGWAADGVGVQSAAYVENNHWLLYTSDATPRPR